MGDTISIKNPQNNLINQHTRASRYDSTAEFRIIDFQQRFLTMLFFKDNSYKMIQIYSLW